MKAFKMVLAYLQNHPIVGVISAGGSTLLSAISVFSSDQAVKAVGVASMYLGVILVLLTIAAKSIEIYKALRK